MRTCTWVPHIKDKKRCEISFQTPNNNPAGFCVVRRRFKLGIYKLLIFSYGHNNIHLDKLTVKASRPQWSLFNTGIIIDSCIINFP